MTERSAYQKALDLLSRRDHFRRELEIKLQRKGYSGSEIEGALDRCRELRLLDDEKVAERFVEVRATSRGWGPRRIAAELERRGVEPALAERMAKLSPDMVESALSTARRRLEVRMPDGWWRDGQRRARMVSSLIGRGFAADHAIAAVAAYAADREREDHAPDEQPPDPIDLS
ncbi:MAG: regulatory protein RecX [Thermoanaerobaculales bacterium]